ncbi:hypothetical protein HHI36_000691 [Cryptolaemus montrouzieri]|uniref:Uncharacterized protein n=1 Tax=Cryptolaemus montrouzieri TaxID=559131 RepID=A0ABD2P5H5_9CUCU
MPKEDYSPEALLPQEEDDTIESTISEQELAEAVASVKKGKPCGFIKIDNPKGYSFLLGDLHPGFFTDDDFEPENMVLLAELFHRLRKPSIREAEAHEWAAGGEDREL